MSKESYARGFVKAAAAAGVDPTALAKFAQVLKDNDVGIGSYKVNNNHDNGSYVGKLVSRDPKPYAVVPYIGSGREDPEKPVSPVYLAFARNFQAADNASRFYPEGSSPWLKLHKNLINAGRQNLSSYKETGEPKLRKVPDMTGIEKLKLTPEQMKWLLKMQNTMVHNSGKARSGAALV